MRRYSNVNPSKIKKGMDNTPTSPVLIIETSSFCQAFVFMEIVYLIPRALSRIEDRAAFFRSGEANCT